jgi:hypothetical protein
MTELDELIAAEVGLSDVEFGARLDYQRARGAGHAAFLAEVDALQREWDALREALPAQIRARVAAGTL